MIKEKDKSGTRETFARVITKLYTGMLWLNKINKIVTVHGYNKKTSKTLFDC